MNKVKIIVYENTLKFINYLIYHKIYYDSLECYDNSFILNVSYDNYKKISRRYKAKIIKYYGKSGFVNYLIFHRYMLLSFLFSMFILYLLSNTIFDIKINSDNAEIVNIIKNILKDSDIELYKSKKSFEELNKIKENILNNNKDKLEWIEIRENGCKYIIDVTPRVKNEIIIDDNSPSSIYASNDGVIKYITVSSGTKIKDINDYVKKGDLLISGNILKNDKIEYSIKAKGRVYAETWYYTNVEIPLKYKEYIKTGRIVNHYYIDAFSHKFTIIGKYDSANVVSKTSVIIDKPYLFFKLYKETKEEYYYKEHNLSENEAYHLALNKSTQKINSMLDSDEYIISKKVLKKELNSSKMYVEVFFKVYENIGVTSNIDNIGESNDKGN